MKKELQSNKAKNNKRTLKNEIKYREAINCSWFRGMFSTIVGRNCLVTFCRYPLSVIKHRVYFLNAFLYAWGIHYNYNSVSSRRRRERERERDSVSSSLEHWTPPCSKNTQATWHCYPVVGCRNGLTGPHTLV